MNINIENTDVESCVNSVRSLLPSNALKACVITFGCQQNEADSEKIRGMAEDMGYAITDDPNQASLIIVNTCAIREHAEMKALSMLGRFKALKKKNPELIIGVAGCMSAEKHRADMLKNDFHYISFTVEPAMVYKIPELVYRALSEHKRTFLFGRDDGNAVEGLRHVRKSNHSAWVSIMYGCNNFCTYCIVPYARGRERSRRSEDVISECSELLALGYKEITLLGQNVNSYKSEMDFAELLESIANIDGDFIIRFMTSHPKDVSDRLIDVMGRHKDKIAPCFHLPLQSGSDSVLKAMNRTYNAEKYLLTVKKLREAVPGIALTSDIIVGFPGEGEVDFEKTLEMLREVRFDMVYSFIYSKRVGTKAAEFENQISDEVKNDRMAKLLALQTEISLEKNQPYVGKILRVLTDSKSKRGESNVYTARTLTNKLVHYESDTDDIGKFVYVKITSAGAFDLYGEKQIIE